MTATPIIAKSYKTITNLNITNGTLLMKKLLQRMFVLASTFMLAAQTSQVSAETEIKEVSNYFEGFDNVATGKDQLAIGWHRIPDITNLGTIDTYRVEALGGMKDDRSVNDQVFSVQYQETWDDETGVSYKTDDLILTPEVKGHVEFYLKYKGQAESYNTWRPSVNIYECTDNLDFSYSKGAEIEIAPVTIPIDSWVKVSVDVTDWTILGLRLENVYFDSFSADLARIPQVQYLQMTGFQCIGGNTVYADEQGNAEINFSIKITNRGNLPISKDQENFNIELQNSMQTIGTYPIGRDMNPGESIEFKFMQPWKLKKITEAETLNLQCVENISRHASSTSQTVRVEVFAPILNITLGDTEIKEYLDLGIFSGSGRKTLNFANLGSKALNITSLKLPEGVKTDFVAPAEIKAHGQLPVSLSFEGKGAIAGNIEIESDGIAPSPSKIHYYGASVEPDIYGTTFDGLTVPARWILENKDAWIGNDRIGQAMRSATSKSSAGKMISPLMTFAEGGKVTMSLSRWATWTESWIKVYTSEDRVNWTEVAHMSSNDENSAFPASQWEFAAYEVPVAAGDKYIAVEGLYANIDNLTGGVLADVDKDVYIHSFTADSKGMVNYPVSATLSVQNIGTADLSAKDYIVEILIDGETAGMADRLETLSKDAVKATDIKVTFTPHKAVESGKITARLSAGDYSTEAIPADITIAKEVIDASKIVGTFNADRSGSNIPMRTGDNNSYSEFIYTAELLGLDKGEKLTAIAFPYSIMADRTAIKNVRIWLQNTYTPKTLRPEAGKAFDVSEMTNVVETSVTLTKTTPSGIFDKYALLEFAFDKAFEYDGRNLRVIVETKSSAFIASEFLNFAGGNTVYTSSDNAINLATVEPDLLPALPVAILTLDKQAIAVTGKITDGTDALSGTSVRFVAGNVLYEAESDVNGVFTAYIMQSDLSYIGNLAAHGYKDFEIAESHYTTATDLGDIAMTANVVASVTVTPDSDKALLSWEAVIPGSADSGVSYDIYLDGAKIKDNYENTEYTLESLSDGLHKVGIAAVFAPSATSTQPTETEFTISLSSLSDVAMSDIKVSAGKNSIDIYTPASAHVYLYNAAGMLIADTDIEAGANSIAAASGIYLLKVVTAEESTTFKIAVK